MDTTISAKSAQSDPKLENSSDTRKILSKLFDPVSISTKTSFSLGPLSKITLEPQSVHYVETSKPATQPEPLRRTLSTNTVSSNASTMFQSNSARNSLILEETPRQQPDFFSATTLLRSDSSNSVSTKVKRPVLVSHQDYLKLNQQSHNDNSVMFEFSSEDESLTVGSPTSAAANFNNLDKDYCESDGESGLDEVWARWEPWWTGKLDDVAEEEENFSRDVDWDADLESSSTATTEAAMESPVYYAEGQETPTRKRSREFYTDDPRSFALDSPPLESVDKSVQENEKHDSQPISPTQLFALNLRQFQQLEIESPLHTPKAYNKSLYYSDYLGTELSDGLSNEVDGNEILSGNRNDLLLDKQTGEISHTLQSVWLHNYLYLNSHLFEELLKNEEENFMGMDIQLNTLPNTSPYTTESHSLQGLIEQAFQLIPHTPSDPSSPVLFSHRRRSSSPHTAVTTNDTNYSLKSRHKTLHSPRSSARQSFSASPLSEPASTPVNSAEMFPTVEGIPIPNSRSSSRVGTPQNTPPSSNFALHMQQSSSGTSSPILSRSPKPNRTNLAASTIAALLNAAASAAVTNGISKSLRPSALSRVPSTDSSTGLSHSRASSVASNNGDVFFGTVNDDISKLNSLDTSISSDVIDYDEQTPPGVIDPGIVISLAAKAARAGAAICTSGLWPIREGQALNSNVTNLYNVQHRALLDLQKVLQQITATLENTVAKRDVGTNTDGPFNLLDSTSDVSVQDESTNTISEAEVVADAEAALLLTVQQGEQVDEHGVPTPIDAVPVLVHDIDIITYDSTTCEVEESQESLTSDPKEETMEIVEEIVEYIDVIEEVEEIEEVIQEIVESDETSELEKGITEVPITVKIDLEVIQTPVLEKSTLLVVAKEEVKEVQQTPQPDTVATVSSPVRPRQISAQAVANALELRVSTDLPETPQSEVGRKNSITRSILRITPSMNRKSVRFSATDFEQVIDFEKGNSPDSLLNTTIYAFEDDHKETKKKYPLPQNVVTEKNFKLATIQKRLFSGCEKPIRLDSIKIEGRTLVGSVLVKNLAFCKRVFIKSTVNDWESFVETEAHYKSSISTVSVMGFEPSIDKFVFYVDVSKPFEEITNGTCEADGSSTIRKNVYFVLRYEVNDTVYWENNNGENYQVELARLVPAEPPKKEKTNSKKAKSPNAGTALNEATESRRTVSLRRSSSGLTEPLGQDDYLDEDIKSATAANADPSFRYYNSYDFDTNFNNVKCVPRSDPLTSLAEKSRMFLQNFNAKVPVERVIQAPPAPPGMDFSMFAFSNYDSQTNTLRFPQSGSLYAQDIPDMRLSTFGINGSLIQTGNSASLCASGSGIEGPASPLTPAYAVEQRNEEEQIRELQRQYHRQME